MFQYKKTYLVLFLLCFGITAFSQDDKLADSTKKAYYKTTVDTSKLQLLSDLAYYYNNLGEFDSSKKYANIGLNLALKYENNKVAVKMYSRLGVSCWNQSEYAEALAYYNKAIKISDDEDALSPIYNNMGLVYWDKGELPTALKYFLKSYDIDKKTNNLDGMSSSVLNMGLIYDDMRDYKNALKYYYNALNLSRQIKDDKGVALCYNNIGQLYSTLKDNYKAMDFYIKSFSLSKKIGDKRNVAMSGNNIGVLNVESGNFSEAEKYYDESLKLYNQIGDIAGQSMVMNNMGDLYNRQERFEEALKLFKALIVFDKTNGLLEDEAIAYRGYALAQSKTGKYKEAYDNFSIYFQLNDSLLKLNNTSQLTEMQKQYEVKEKEKEINMQRATDQMIAKAEKKKQTYIIIATLIILVLIIIFSFFLFKRFKVTQRQNAIIQKQKHLVEEKQKEILDSINYAKRIQYALLASDELLEKYLPEHFVLFKPKDVVSGDFYWATPTDTGFIYATADCTGHGVPGAFMSLLNISKLSQTINENKITRPDLILNNVRTEIIKALNPGGSKEESKDGMDAILCNLDVKNMRLQYAAANNSFYIVRDNKIVDCKADKMPVGKGHDDSILFKHNEMDLQKGDTIYTLTDGYADQFGGEKGKKFRYKQLEELLIAINKEPMETQKERLDTAFVNWLGELEQVDDVCIIGVRV